MPNPAQHPHQPRTQKDLVLGLDRLPLPMARTTRELFELFALGRPGDLPGLLDRLDFAGVIPHQVYQLVHERAPERLDLFMRPAGYDARKHMEAALLSAEFQEKALPHLLHAFPEKRRDVFIHVPKCAGTDLILNVGARQLSVPKMLEEEGWVSKQQLFEALRCLVQAVPYYESFFVYGHMSLGSFVRRVGVRAGDRIFTVIREPLELMLSQANYAVTRLRQDPTGHDPDAREFLARFEMDRLPDSISLVDLKALALRALLHPEIARADRISAYLGDEQSPRYETALSNLVRYNVEITTTRHYRQWLAERWGISSQSRHNMSDHWLSADDLDDSTLADLSGRTSEDQKVFEVVSSLLSRSGKPAITGAEIAEAAGAQSFEDFAESLPSTPRERSRRSGTRRSSDIKVVQGAPAIATVLDSESAEDAILRIVFGLNGNSKGYLREGWANPEPRFVWTSAPVSRLEIPKPAGNDCVLRLLGGPFVVKDRLPSQRLMIAVNGIVLGTATASDRSLIECEVPQVVLGGADTAVITLTLPDAAKPADLTGAEDQRILGFAVERLELLRRETLEGKASPHVAEPIAVGTGDATSRPGAPDAQSESAGVSSGPEALMEPAPQLMEAAPSGPGNVDPLPVAAEAVQRAFHSVSVGQTGAERTGALALPASELELPLRELMLRFESIGENCEFGLVQRRCGAEPLGLFRFASAPLPKLLAGLGARFEGLSHPDNLDVQLSPNGREYLVTDRKFQLLYHAWVLADEMTAQEVHQREVRRLPLLIRKFLEDLSEAKKIFVYHGMEPLSDEDANRLLAELRSYGPNALLWVETADAQHAPGSVEWRGEGLLKAYIDRFAPGEDAHDLSLDCWIAICREAYRLCRNRADAGGRQTGPAPASAAAQ